MRIGIVGCGGQMGRALVREVAATPGCELAGGTGRPGSAVIGRDVAEQADLAPVGLRVGDDPEALFRASEVVIDCTAPEASVVHAGLAARHRVALVVGTSGLDSSQQNRIETAAAETALLQSANLTFGANVLFRLTEVLAAMLGEEYDAEILDIHPGKKKDSPSGTALALGRIVAATRGRDFDRVVERARDGMVGPRRAGAIGVTSLRGGDSGGDHMVMFAGPGERFEIIRRAYSHANASRAGVRAARWLAGKPAGFYSMRDVYGF